MTVKETLMDVDEVMASLDRSKSYAYKLIRKLNKELENKGYLTENGKVSRKYFSERYGLI